MNTTTIQQHRLSRKARIYMIRSLMGHIIGGLIFFLAAGTLNLPRGWIYYVMTVLLTLVSNLVIARHNSELLEQRSRIQPGSKGWDKWWLVFYALLFIHGMSAVAGWEIGRLDQQMPSWTFYLGLPLYLFTMTFVTWAMSVNRHFEPSVRIQSDRDHQVISTGPYAMVRHPGYSAIVAWALAYPLMVGSSIALFQGMLLILFVMLRTWLEDRTLYSELEGYPEYTRKVRYRLIPLIW